MLNARRIIFIFLTFGYLNCDAGSMWRHLLRSPGTAAPIRDGNYLWIPSYTGYLVKYDLINNNYQLIDYLNTPAPTEAFWHIGMDSTGKKWITNTEALLSFDDFNWTRQDKGFSSGGTYCMNVLPNGEIWLLSFYFLKYDGQHWDSLSQLNGVSLVPYNPTGTYIPFQDGDTLYTYNTVTDTNFNNKPALVKIFNQSAQ